MVYEEKKLETLLSEDDSSEVEEFSEDLSADENSDENDGLEDIEEDDEDDSDLKDGDLNF